MTVCNTANAIIELFERCRDDLPIDKLEWLDGLTDHARNEADNLSTALMSMAMLHGHDGATSALPSASMLSEILFGLADRASTISALIHVSSEAAYLVNKKR